MMDKKDAIGIERQPRISGGPRKVWLFKCVYPNCSETIKLRSTDLSTKSGLCLSHSHVKRPFESIYNGLFNDWRKPKILLTYEEFLGFTKIDTCHYCGTHIEWVPYGTVMGKFLSRAYHLDKKICTGPYSKNNCVVCCTECNKMRGNRFSYEEFLKIGKVIKDIKMKRRLKGGNTYGA